MDEPLAPVVWNVTHSNMWRLYEATLPLLVALCDMVRPLAARRANEAVSDGVASDARAVLADARRVLAREAVPGVLEIRRTLDWATLLGKLELAIAAFAVYRNRYRYYDSRLALHVWRDEAWLSLLRMEADSINSAKALHEK